MLIFALYAKAPDGSLRAVDSVDVVNCCGPSARNTRELVHTFISAQRGALKYLCGTFKYESER